MLLNCPPVGPPQPPWSVPTGPPGVWNIKKCQILLSWVHRNTNPPEKLMKNSYFYNLQNWPPWPPKPPTPWPPWGSQISSMTKTQLIGSLLVQPNQKIGKKALNGPNPTWPPFWTHSGMSHFMRYKHFGRNLMHSIHIGNKIGLLESFQLLTQCTFVELMF